MGVGRGATPADAEEEDDDPDDETVLELDPEGVGGIVGGLSGVPP